MLGDRRIERGLAILIWLSLPFLLHLMTKYPGGYGQLLLGHPEYFFLASVAALAAMLILFAGSWLVVEVTTWLAVGAPVFGTYNSAAAAVLPWTGERALGRRGRRLAHRVLMTSIVSTFSITVILLSLSWFLAQRLPTGNGHSSDALSWFPRQLGYVGNPYEPISGLLHAILAALIVNLAIVVASNWLRRPLSQRAAGSGYDENLVQDASTPNVFVVATASYATLQLALYLTTFSVGWFTALQKLVL
jgi:hypothetical protein